MNDISHQDVTWAGVQAAFANTSLFVSLSEPERKQLHTQLSHLRIEYDWYDVRFEDEAGTKTQLAALETLKKSFSSVAELLAGTSPTSRGVAAALERAASHTAQAACARVAELQAAIEALHARASGTGRIAKKELAEMRRLTALLDEASRALPFDPADPCAPFLFVAGLCTSARTALAMIPDAKKRLRSAMSNKAQSEIHLSAIEWLSGVALPELYEALSRKAFSRYISDKRASLGLEFVMCALDAMSIRPEGKGKKGLVIPLTL